MFNLPAERPHLYEPGRLGGAVLADANEYFALLSAAAAGVMTRIGQVFHPEPQHAKTYEALYTQVYRHMYGRLQPLYKAIQDITGSSR